VPELRKHDRSRRSAPSCARAGCWDDPRDAAIREQVQARVQAAFEFARTSPYPATTEATEHVSR